MKFYNSVGPNPRIVRMFMAEKGLEIPQVEVDILAGENRQPDYLKINPHGQCPALALDNGQCISEILAICEYLEEIHPDPPLIGSTPEERAEARMVARRVDTGICEPLANGFRFSEGLKLFEPRIMTRPEAAEGLKAMAQDRLSWWDGQLEGRQFLAGDRITVGDVVLFGFLDWGATVGQPLNEDNKNVMAWYERMKARPSAAA